MTSTPFELAGHFGGFVFTDLGKRRMLLRVGDQDRLLKVPRTLRRRLIGKFPVGEWLRVAGTEEREPATGVLKQVVSRVLSGAGDSTVQLPLAAPAPAASCVVRVCSKKNCWRHGGRELFDALGRAAAASGHADRIEIRQVGCLDRCKHGPNADGGNRAYSRCSPGDAARIIAQTTGGLPPRS